MAGYGRPVTADGAAQKGRTATQKGEVVGQQKCSNTATHRDAAEFGRGKFQGFRYRTMNTVPLSFYAHTVGGQHNCGHQ